MKVSMFYLPGVGSRQDVEQGMAGLRGDLYQAMLLAWTFGLALSWLWWGRIRRKPPV